MVCRLLGSCVGCSCVGSFIARQVGERVGR